MLVHNTITTGSLMNALMCEIRCFSMHLTVGIAQTIAYFYIGSKYRTYIQVVNVDSLSVFLYYAHDTVCSNDSVLGY
jgi:hypothetical protein